MISFWKETLLNHFRMMNYLCVPILEVINVLLSKLYDLLQIMLFCGNLIILWKRNPFESIQNVNLPLCTKFGDNKWITSQIIQFAAFSSLISEKSAAAAAAAAATKIFWHRDLSPHTKWGKVNEFQKKISSGLVVITEKL